MSYPRLSPERVREIPVLEIDFDEMYMSQKGFIPPPLGGDHFFWTPDGRVDPDKFNNVVWQSWQQDHPWVPVVNRKFLPTLARALHHNPDSRAFIEAMDQDQGVQFIEDLKVRGVTEHAPRLLTSKEAPALTAFTVAYFESLLPHDEKRMEYIEEALPRSRDGNSGTQFWGIAPYVFERLRQPEPLTGTSLGSRQVIDTILDWSFAKKTYGDLDDAVYPGFYSDGLHQGLYLAAHGSHPSHALARKIGVHVADQLRPLANNPRS